MNSPKRPLKHLTEFRPSQGYAACDGPSCLRRSVLLLLSQSSETQFIKESMTARHVFDGPSYHFVAKFRELISVPKFLNSKCFGTRPPRWSVVPMTVRRGIRRLRQLLPEITLLLKTTK